MDIKPKYYANATRSADDSPPRVSEFKMTSFVFFYRTYARISYRKTFIRMFYFIFLQISRRDAAQRPFIDKLPLLLSNGYRQHLPV